MTEARVYPVSPRRRAVLVGVWAVLVAPLAIGGLIAGEWALLITAAVISLVMLPFFAWVIRAARLIIGPEGIEARQVGARLQTPWSNVAHLLLKKGQEGFVLHEPMTGAGARNLAEAGGVRISSMPLYGADRAQLIAEQRFIPIEAFAYWLERGDLREAIERWSPGLCTPSERRPDDSGATTEQSSELPTRVLILVVAALVAGGIAFTFVPAGVQDVLLRISTAIVGLSLGTLAVRNGGGAVARLRSGSTMWGLLWAAMAVVQALLALLAVSLIFK